MNQAELETAVGRTVRRAIDRLTGALTYVAIAADLPAFLDDLATEGALHEAPRGNIFRWYRVERVTPDPPPHEHTYYATHGAEASPYLMLACRGCDATRSVYNHLPIEVPET